MIASLESLEEQFELEFELELSFWGVREAVHHLLATEGTFWWKASPTRPSRWSVRMARHDGTFPSGW